MRKQYGILIMSLSLVASLVEGASDVVIKQCTDFVDQAEKNMESKVPDLKGKMREILKWDINRLNEPVLAAAQESGIPFEENALIHFIIDIKLDKADLHNKCIDAFEQNEHKRNLIR